MYKELMPVADTVKAIQEYSNQPGYVGVDIAQDTRRCVRDTDFSGLVYIINMVNGRAYYEPVTFRYLFEVSKYFEE